jgi:hypothetical protein
VFGLYNKELKPQWVPISKKGSKIKSLVRVDLLKVEDAQIETFTRICPANRGDNSTYEG